MLVVLLPKLGHCLGVVDLVHVFFRVLAVLDPEPNQVARIEDYFVIA